MRCYLALSIFLTGSLQLIGNTNNDCATCENGWNFKIAPYIWMAGLKGEVGAFPGLPPISVDFTFSRILRDLNGVLMLAGEVRNGPLSLAGDVMYVKLSTDVTTPGPLFARARVDCRYLVGTVSCGYSLVDNDCLSLDALLGGRIWSIDTQLLLPAGLLPKRFFSNKKRWMDPMVGLRWSIDLKSGFSFQGRGIIGGFDVSSKLFWDIYGGVVYSCDEHFQFLLGYRYLSVDFKDTDFLFDVRQYGPIMGFIFSF